MRSVLTTLAMTVALATPALAAQVTPENGEVLVNSGSGFKPVSGTTEVSAGAQVMVRPGGSAFIVYSATCTTRVGSERVWAVQAAAPCSAGKTSLDFTGRMSQDGSTGTPGVGPGFWIPAVIVGGVVIAAAVWVATDDDENKPTSP